MQTKEDYISRIAEKVAMRVVKIYGSSSVSSDSFNGLATEDWVDENYISIEFFSRLFQAHGTENGQQTDIDPNDMDSTITSIESMFGFWTDYYMSALGNGGGLGSTLYLSTLADVLISSPANNQVLTYNATIGKWVNANAQAGVTDLASLTDVTLTTPQTNQVLIYDYGNSRWVNSSLKTVNGYSLIGSGNIDASGGGTGNYVAKAGDTMTGALTFSTGSGYVINFPQYSLGYNLNTDFFFYTTNNISFAIWTSGEKRLKVGGNGYIGVGVENPICALDISGATLASWYSFRRNNNTSMGFIGNGDASDNVSIANYTSGSIDLVMGSSYKIVLRATVSGYVGINKTSPTQSLDVVGNIQLTGNTMFKYGEYLDEYGNIHQSASNSIWAVISNSNRFNISVIGSGNVGIGTVEPSYELHVIGTIYATGAVTALSDARKKDVQGDAKIGVEQIADAPAVQFLWLGERAKEGLQVGTLAQYWQAVLPEVVMDKGGELSMQYGVAALVSAIITARKVVDHERRISELEKENERLKTEVEQLRLN